MTRTIPALVALVVPSIGLAQTYTMNDVYTGQTNHIHGCRDQISYDDAWSSMFDTSTATAAELTAMQAAADAGTLQLEIDNRLWLWRMGEVEVCVLAEVHGRHSGGQPLHPYEVATGATPTNPYEYACVSPDLPEGDGAEDGHLYLDSNRFFGFPPGIDVATLEIRYDGETDLDCDVQSLFYQAALDHWVDAMRLHY